jgi:hypothetical protein
MKRNRYTITFTNKGSIKIAIPETWKITFGPLAPGNVHMGMAVRVYEGINKLKAVYPNVNSVIEDGIKLLIETEPVPAPNLWEPLTLHQ